MLDGAPARPIRPYFSRSFLRGKRSAVVEKSGRPGKRCRVLSVTDTLSPELSSFPSPSKIDFRALLLVIFW